MINILYLHAGSEMYGADKILLELVTGLDKSKFHPIVVLPSQGKLSSAMDDAAIENYVIDYPILRRKYFNVSGIFNYLKSYHQAIKNIYRLVKEKQIQIIHVNTLAVLEGISLKRKLRVPLVWHIHEIIQSPKIVYKVTSFLVGKFATKVVTVSNAVKQNLLHSRFVPASKLQVIYNGIDNDVYNPSNKTDYLYKEFHLTREQILVGMIGRVNSWKGQDDFLNAVTPLLKKHKDLIALMIGGVFKGEEWRFQALKKNIEESGFANQIILSNFREDTPNLHDLFDVFVLPSIKPDPLPTVVLESMASGKPIVGYEHGGIVEMVENHKNGTLVEVGNKIALSNAIEQLILNKKLRMKYGDVSLERETRLFSLNTFIDNFQKLYSQLYH